MVLPKPSFDFHFLITMWSGVSICSGSTYCCIISLFSDTCFILDFRIFVVILIWYMSLCVCIHIFICMDATPTYSVRVLMSISYYFFLSPSHYHLFRNRATMLGSDQSWHECDSCKHRLSFVWLLEFIGHFV